MRITVQLVDVGTNRQLWGNTYKGKLDDIFDIQEQVAQQIVEALRAAGAAPASAAAVDMCSPFRLRPRRPSSPAGASGARVWSSTSAR